MGAMAPICVIVLNLVYLYLSIKVNYISGENERIFSHRSELHSKFKKKLRLFCNAKSKIPSLGLVTVSAVEVSQGIYPTQRSLSQCLTLQMKIKRSKVLRF